MSWNGNDIQFLSIIDRVKRLEVSTLKKTLGKYVTNETNLTTLVEGLQDAFDNLEYVKSIAWNGTTFTMIITKEDDTTLAIDLPLEQMIVDVTYDDVEKELIFELNNGTTLVVPLEDIISGLVKTSDIVDNLTTDDATKVLSAKQGKQLEDSKVAEAPTDGKAYVRVNGAWVADIITNIGTFSDASYIMEHLIVNNLPTGIYKANVSAFGGFEVIINYQRTLTTAKGTVQSFDSLTVVDIDLSGGLPVIVRNDQFNINAETLPYDRSGSGLLATNVQDAIDELDGKKLGKSSSNSGTFAYIRHHTTDEMRELTSSPVADKIPLFKSNALLRTLSGNTASRPSTVLHAGDQYFNTDNNQMEVYIGDANHWLNQVYKNGDTLPTPASGASHTYHVISDGAVLSGTPSITIDGELVYGSGTTGTTLIVTNDGGTLKVFNMDNTGGVAGVSGLTLSATKFALKRVA